jgi:hypothetical protein
MNNENTDPQATTDDSAEQDFQRALDRVDAESEQATFAEGLVPETQNPVDIAQPEPEPQPEPQPNPEPSLVSESRLMPIILAVIGLAVIALVGVLIARKNMSESDE